MLYQVLATLRLTRIPMCLGNHLRQKLLRNHDSGCKVWLALQPSEPRKQSQRLCRVEAKAASQVNLASSQAKLLSDLAAGAKARLPHILLCPAANQAQLETAALVAIRAATLLV